MIGQPPRADRGQCLSTLVKSRRISVGGIALLRMRDVARPRTLEKPGDEMCAREGETRKKDICDRAVETLRTHPGACGDVWRAYNARTRSSAAEHGAEEIRQTLSQTPNIPTCVPTRKTKITYLHTPWAAPLKPPSGAYRHTQDKRYVSTRATNARMHKATVYATIRRGGTLS